MTEALLKLGVEVTLYATSSSWTKGKLRAVVPSGYSEDLELDRWVSSMLHISALFEHADDFDVIHNHFDFAPLAFTSLVKTPVVTTVHGLSPAVIPIYRKYGHLPYVSISWASRASGLNYISNVYHGIDVSSYAFNGNPGNYLLFIGRICAEKGVHEAIQLAQATGRPLHIAGIIQDPTYFREQVEPFLDGNQIRFHGPVGGRSKLDLLRNALATVHLCKCEEAFGLSIVESLACGTPVIAARRGAIPELIDDGCGVLVDSVSEAIDRFSRAPDIDRAACRRVAEDRFTSKRMAEEYLSVYREVIASHARASRGSHA